MAISLSLGSLSHRPCPQTGPGRSLQKKPRPLDAKAPPRTCGPAPSSSSSPSSRVPSKARRFLASEACPSQEATVSRLVRMFLLRSRPCPQAPASSQVGPYETPKSSEGRSLRREGAGPGGVDALLPWNADCDPAPALGRCRETSVDALARAWPGQ